MSTSSNTERISRTSERSSPFWEGPIHDIYNADLHGCLKESDMVSIEGVTGMWKASAVEDAFNQNSKR